GYAFQIIQLYIPDRDRDNEKIPNHQAWVDEAARLIAPLGDGFTIVPVRGGWYEEKADGSTGEVIENTSLIYCFITHPERIAPLLPNLRSFLHRFGRETNQGAVAVEIDNMMFMIRNYDNP